MIIKTIKISNFRQFRGDNEITVGKSDDANINIIIGSTGYGKTNLSNAIQWCLYGEDIVGSESMGLLNMNSFEELENGQTDEVEVQLFIETDKGESYTISRSARIKKDGSRQTYPDSVAGKLKIFFHRRDEAPLPTYDENEPNDLINDIFPKRIKEYFFFDGERLEQYFKSGASMDIKESVFRVSQLDLLESVAEKLTLVIRDYRRQSVDKNPETEGVNKAIETNEDQTRRKSCQINDANENLEKLKVLRTKKMEELKRYGGEGTKILLRQNEDIDTKLPIQMDNLNEKEEEKRVLLMSMSYLIVGQLILDDSLKYFKEAEKRGLIPPNIDPAFISELLQKGECICGNDVSKNNLADRKNLEDYLDNLSMTVGKNPRMLLDVWNDTGKIIQNDLPGLSKEVGRINEVIKILSSQVQNLTKQKENNLQQIRTQAGLGDFKDVESNIADLETQIENENRNIATYSSEKDILEKEHKDLEKQQKELLSLSDRNAYLLRCIGLCESARTEAENIKEKIMNEIREEISKLTTQYFREFHSKEESDLIVNIDENYRIKALERGRELFDVFSKGEGALMAMSFIFALHSVSGFNVPLFLDTALGRIDEMPKANWGACISKYLKYTQMFLLFTSSEYSEEVKDSLENFVFSKYEISLQKNPWDQSSFEKVI